MYSGGRVGQGVETRTRIEGSAPEGDSRGEGVDVGWGGVFARGDIEGPVRTDTAVSHPAEGPRDRPVPPGPGPGPALGSGPTWGEKPGSGEPHGMASPGAVVARDIRGPITTCAGPRVVPSFGRCS